jgi:hypothetical protein
VLGGRQMPIEAVARARVVARKLEKTCVKRIMQVGKSYDIRFGIWQMVR